MSRGYRLSLIAVVGWLIANPALSQQAEQQEPQSQGEGSAEQSNPTPFSVPVRILENPEQAEADKRSQQEASQREIEDLTAQQGMAKGTQDIVWLSKLQLALAFAGTLALLYTIALNRRATNAAVTANTNTLTAINQEQDNAQRQLRAYLSVTPAGIIKCVGEPTYEASVFIKNVGQAIATEVTAKIWARVLMDANSDELTDADSLVSMADPYDRVGSILPRAEVQKAAQGGIDHGDIEGLHSVVNIVFVWGEVKYVDGFKNRRFTRFCHWYEVGLVKYDHLRAFGIGPEIGRFHRHGNDAD